MSDTILIIPAITMQGAVTPASAAQFNVKPKISVAPRPRIRVVIPKVRIRIDRQRLARNNQGNKRKNPTANGMSDITVQNPKHTSGTLNPSHGFGTQGMPGYGHGITGSTYAYSRVRPGCFWYLTRFQETGKHVYRKAYMKCMNYQH